MVIFGEVAKFILSSRRINTITDQMNQNKSTENLTKIQSCDCTKINFIYLINN